MRTSMASNQGGACKNSSVGIFWGGQIDDNSSVAESVDEPRLAWMGRYFFGIARIAGLVKGEALYPEMQGLQKWRTCRLLFQGQDDRLL